MSGCSAFDDTLCEDSITGQRNCEQPEPICWKNGTKVILNEKNKTPENVQSNSLNTIKSNGRL
jgi:hypothetical protein